MQAQNGHAPMDYQPTVIVPPTQPALTFSAPHQPFTVSAPPTAVASAAPTPATIAPPLLHANTGTPMTATAPAVQPAVGQGLTMPPTAPDQGRSLRKRLPTESNGANGSNGAGSGGAGAAERTTRSGTSFSARPKWMPKLKLKVSEGSDGRRQSFLGPYDRDLDSEDEELVFEEHFILRMPEGKEADKLREMVSKRSAMPDVWFKFKDPRRAIFHIGDNLHPAKLVDLPCILESQKTLDNKHMFKVADICQMLVVEDTVVPSEEALQATKKAFNTNEFVWPHGLTPPLQHVRRRRFRKRLNRQAIEIVENEVDRLLAEEKGGTNVEEILFEDADPDLSDSEYLARVMPPKSPVEDEEGGMVKEENDDDAFAAVIERALQQASEDEDDDNSGSEEDDDMDGDEDEDQDEAASDSDTASGSASDEDDDDEEYSGAKKLVDDEIRQLESAIAKKNADIAKVTNVALKNRFLNAVAKMTADLDAKLALREQLLAEHRAAREREAMEEADEDEDEEDEDGAGRVVGVAVGGAVAVATAGVDEFFGAQSMDIS